MRRSLPVEEYLPDLVEIALDERRELEFIDDICGMRHSHSGRAFMDFGRGRFERS